MLKSKFYPCTVLKTVPIGDQEIKPGTPLFIKLYEHETPDKFYLNIERDISRLAFTGPPAVFAHVALKDFYQLIKWQVKP